MTNREMLEIAMRQSAEDLGCREADLAAGRNVAVPLKMGKNARKYLKQPITCSLVSYGNNVVAASINETFALVREYIGKFEGNTAQKSSHNIARYDIIKKWINK